MVEEVKRITTIDKLLPVDVAKANGVPYSVIANATMVEKLKYFFNAYDDQIDNIVFRFEQSIQPHELIEIDISNLQLK